MIRIQNRDSGSGRGPVCSSLIGFAFSHFCVDFACFFVPFHSFAGPLADRELISVGFLAYNTVAFGFQPFLGFFCDGREKVPVSQLGCLLVLTGLLIIPHPWMSLLLCAIGNACFHVGGGIDSLTRANGRMTRSGIFVSTGVLGVAAGTIGGKEDVLSVMIPAVLLLISFLLLAFLGSRSSGKMSFGPVKFRITRTEKPAVFILSFCFVLIVIRSFTGSAIPMGWRTSVPLILLPAAGACIGKAAGGILADRFGAGTVGLGSLVLSIPLLCLGYADPILCTIGILLFNMTMPIALCAIADILPGYPGLSFGVTTLGLLCGNIPTYFMAVPVGYNAPVIAVLLVSSLFCIQIAIRNQKGGKVFEKMDQTT